MDHANGDEFDFNLLFPSPTPATNTLAPVSQFTRRANFPNQQHIPLPPTVITNTGTTNFDDGYRLFLPISTCSSTQTCATETPMFR